MSAPSGPRVPVAVFASGSGTNLQAILDLEDRTSPPWRVVLVVSDREDAYALERARRAARDIRVIPVRGRSLEAVGEETVLTLREYGVQVVLLAGYLRLIPESVVAAYPRRILNLHPALLPFFGGKGMYGHHVHEAVLQSGTKVTGVSVHFVDEEYDTGTVFAQWPVPVRAGDTPDILAERIHRVEHVLYPIAVDQLCRAVAEGGAPPRFSLSLDAFRGCPDQDFDDLTAHITQAFGAS